ncbi:MAG TPA: ABC transporter ATP-binding protein, partial [Cyclobacteriaceae bacterium]|nr:ABC transporter ATP-binding protein [Cyclobacteriaceae bacterium]
MPLLKVSNVTCQIEDTLAVNAVSFTQKKLEKIAISGETGSGKSTLLKMIAGLIQPSSGAVYFDDVRIAGPDEKLVAGHANIAYLSQHFELRKFLRVEQVLEYANKLTADEAQTLFEICRIDHLLKRKTDELSGGEKQRIAIARLLISAPRLLLLDEPFSNLDMTQRNTLKTMLEDICRGLKITCILVSHDPQDVLTWADKILIMRGGSILQKGTPEDVYKLPVNAYTAGLFGKFSTLTLSETQMPVPGRNKIRRKELYVRPENLQLVSKQDKGVKGRVTKVVFTGNAYELELATATEELIVQT